MTWSPDGKTVVVGNRHDVVLWIDVASQKVIKEERLEREVRPFVLSFRQRADYSAVDERGPFLSYRVAAPQRCRRHHRHRGVPLRCSRAYRARLPRRYDDI